MEFKIAYGGISHSTFVTNPVVSAFIKKSASLFALTVPGLQIQIILVKESSVDGSLFRKALLQIYESSPSNTLNFDQSELPLNGFLDARKTVYTFHENADATWIVFFHDTDAEALLESFSVFATLVLEILDRDKRL